MRWLASSLYAFSLVAMLTSCDKGGEFITDTSPFFEESVPTPPGGHRAIAERSKIFAKKHRMKVHYVAGHFKHEEFSILLTRDDINIVADNVNLRGRTLVAAYTTFPASGRQRALVIEFKCSVMLYDCRNRSPHGDQSLPKQ
jgi:hypothetical protein